MVTANRSGNAGRVDESARVGSGFILRFSSITSQQVKYNAS